MNAVPARLIVKLGPNPNKEYTLARSEITIGRGSGNAIVIQSPEVSRRHARIRRDGNSYFIEDWGSTNGTFVSGQRVMNLTLLRNKDTIKLGDSIILLFTDEPDNIAPLAEGSVSSLEHDVTMVDAVAPQLPPSQARNEPLSAPPVVTTEAAKDDFILPNDQDTNTSNRLRIFGCGCIILLIPLLCIAVLIFLDFYEQGRLLYCGPARPLFEIFLGPLGFAPICP